MKIKTYDEWKLDKYGEAMQWRDWQTCEYLVEFEHAIKMGYEAALSQINKSLEIEFNEDIELHADGVKEKR